MTARPLAQASDRWLPPSRRVFCRCLRFSSLRSRLVEGKASCVGCHGGLSRTSRQNKQRASADPTAGWQTTSTQQRRHQRTLCALASAATSATWLGGPAGASVMMWRPGRGCLSQPATKAAAVAAAAAATQRIIVVCRAVRARLCHADTFCAHSHHRQDLKDKFRECGTVVYANVTRGDDGEPLPASVVSQSADCLKTERAWSALHNTNNHQNTPSDPRPLQGLGHRRVRGR